MSDSVQFLDKLHAASTPQFPGPQPTLSRSRHNSSNLLTRSTVQCSSVHPVSFNSTNCWKCCTRWSLYGEIYRYIGNIAAGKARISSNLSQIMAKQESTPVSSCSCPPGLGSCRYKPVERIRKSRYYLESQCRRVHLVCEHEAAHGHEAADAEPHRVPPLGRRLRVEHNKCEVPHTRA